MITAVKHWDKPYRSSFHFITSAKEIESLPIPYPRWSRKAMPEQNRLLLQAAKENRLVVHDFGSDGKDDPLLLGMLSKESDAPFTLICPGGAFISVDSPNEGVPVAAKLNEHGINAFVLIYSVGMGSHDKALNDLKNSLLYIASQAESLKINMDDYRLMGFSAGAFYTLEAGLQRLDYESMDLSKPGSIAACYPIVSLDGKDQKLLSKYHAVMRQVKHLAYGPFSSREEVLSHDIFSEIDATFPDLFIWQGKEDSLVSYESNAKRLAQTALQAGVHCCLDTFHIRKHGVGLAEDTDAEPWFEDYLVFLEERAH